MTTSQSRAPEPGNPDAAKTVAIIGAGPAGLYAAERLASHGLRVQVFDQKAAPARKFLMAGRGGLNLTYTTPPADALLKYPNIQKQLSRALETFTPEKLVAWANGLGQETFVGSSGHVFPKAMKASPLLRAWLQRLAGLGVEINLHHRWLGWNDDGALVFEHKERASATGRQTKVVKTDATVLALGGASWPHLGSDGAWSKFLGNKNVEIAPFRASNAGLKINWSEQVNAHAGVPLKNISMTAEQKTVHGEVVITDQGLEGGVCYALNPILYDLLQHASDTELKIDLKPDLTAAALAERIAKPRGRQTLTNHIRKASALTAPALALLREPMQGKLPTDSQELATLIKGVPLRCLGLNSLDRAISSAGGVRLTDLNNEFMFTGIPSVFAAGEMLDWDAPTGGYLLQATFATAHGCAEGVLSYLRVARRETPKIAAT